MISFPTIPHQGGELAKYLSEIENEVGWIPHAASQRAQALAQALDSENDPSTWVAYAGATLQTVWQAMPADIRNQIQLALRDLIDLGLAHAFEVSSLAAQAAVSSAVNAVPFIGDLIQALLIVINAGVDYGKQIDDQNYRFSSQNYWAKRFETVRQYTHPDALVYQQMHVLNYFDYKGEGNEWRYRPCFARSSGAADLMFHTTSGLADTGSCTKGVLMDCPSGSFFDFDDCHFENQSSMACVRRLGVSSLFYPYWSPAYSDAGLPAEGGEDARLNVSNVLSANQVALLASPSVNLRVDSKRLLKIRDRFQSRFMNQAKMYKPSGHSMGLLQIVDGLAPGGLEKLAIAPTKEVDYKPKQSRLDKFYLDADGLIQAYPNTGVNPNQWGVRVSRGPQTPLHAAVTVAQYNAVVGATLAFMSARANFLRSGPLMAALVEDFGLQSFDAPARSAMQFAANYGKEIPAPVRDGRPARVSKKPARVSKGVVLKTIPARPVQGAPGRAGSGDGGGGVLLVGSAATALFFYLKSRG